MRQRVTRSVEACDGARVEVEAYAGGVVVWTRDTGDLWASCTLTDDQTVALVSHIRTALEEARRD